MRILVVEDEQRIAAALKDGLEQETYAVDTEHDGEDGYNAASADDYDLIILDIMLPGMNGYDTCRRLRAEHKTMPILMLTAKDQDQDVVHGLDIGADDYLPKPFSFDVLLARVRSLLRRPQITSGEVLQAGNLTFNPANHEVRRDGQIITLSNKEYALLEYLLRNKNKVLSKHNIMTHVWDFDADILPNTVEVFINYLRSKIDKPFAGQPALVKTVRGFGYKIEDTDVG